MSAPKKPPRGIRINPEIRETEIPGAVPPVQISLEDIRQDPTIQQRAGGTVGALVDEYALTISDWIGKAPVTVFRDGSGVWLADGYHRAKAAALAGLQSLPCVVHPGGYRAALLFACGANATHGARRTGADKRRAVETLLKDPEWCQWSDRRIADEVGVSPTTVGTLRVQLSKLDTSPAPTTAPPAAGAVGTLPDARPVEVAEHQDLAPLALTLQPRVAETDPPAVTDTEPAPKRIGKDGKARHAPVSNPPSKPLYRAIDIDAAHHLHALTKRLYLGMTATGIKSKPLAIAEARELLADIGGTAMAIVASITIAVNIANTAGDTAEGTA